MKYRIYRLMLTAGAVLAAVRAAWTGIDYGLPPLATIAFTAAIFAVFMTAAHTIGRPREFTFTCPDPACTVSASVTTTSSRDLLAYLDAYTADHAQHGPATG